MCKCSLYILYKKININKKQQVTLMHETLRFFLQKLTFFDKLHSVHVTCYPSPELTLTPAGDAV